MTDWELRNDEVDALAARWARQGELDAAGLRELGAETYALCDRLAADEELEGLMALLELPLPRDHKDQVARALAGFGDVVVAPLLALRHGDAVSPEFDEGVGRVFEAMEPGDLRRGLEGVLAQQSLAFIQKDALDMLDVSVDDDVPTPRELLGVVGAWAVKAVLEGANERQPRTRPVNAEVVALLDRWYAAANDYDVAAAEILGEETRTLVGRLTAAGDVSGLADLLDLPGVEGAAAVVDAVSAVLVGLGVSAVPTLDLCVRESDGGLGGARAADVRNRIEKQIGFERMEEARAEAKAEIERIAQEQAQARAARSAASARTLVQPQVVQADDLVGRWFAAADAEDAAALERLRAETDYLITTLNGSGDAAALVALLELPAIAQAEPLLHRLEDLLVARGEGVLGLLLLAAQRSGGGLATDRGLEIAGRIDPDVVTGG